MSNCRAYWLRTMDCIVRPVLKAVAHDELVEKMPIESKSAQEERAQFTYLEAFARALVGIAPWLELEGLVGEEAALQAEYRKMALAGIHNGVTPGCKDYMNFSVGGQPIVDAAFLAHAILRAPKQLWHALPAEDKKNLVAQMKRTRTRKPPINNWLLFCAMIETFLHFAGEEDWDPMRTDLAIRYHFDWYKGDGFFGDGKNFHMDYYNSYVIQPMLIDILRYLHTEDGYWRDMLPLAQQYGAHYATFLEHLIMPDGTYPILGRSVAYRFGCFQMLAQAALQDILEDDITPAQVRCGLTAVMQRIMAFDNFDENGWLTIGVCGHQPDMGEHYISTGSLYLCSAVFLPLGLPEAHPFWSAPDAAWTMKKMWAGDPCMVVDHAI